MITKADIAAHYICDLSDWTLTNLQLHKLLYISHIACLGELGKPLVDRHFEAWEYGPVCPYIYRKTRQYGARPIGNVFGVDDERRPDADLKTICDDVFESVGHERAAKLIAITHADIGAWTRVYEPGVSRIEIPEHEMIAEYHRWNSEQAS